jgi:hypothetical protein
VDEVGEHELKDRRANWETARYVGCGADRELERVHEGGERSFERASGDDVVAAQAAAQHHREEPHVVVREASERRDDLLEFVLEGAAIERERRLERRAHGVERLLDDGLVERLLRGEVIEHRGAGDARGAGDVLEAGCLVAAGAERLGGASEEDVDDGFRAGLTTRSSHDPYLLSGR